MTHRALLRLNPERKSRIAGSIRVAGQDVMALRGAALEDFRGKVASMIFQQRSLALACRPQVLLADEPTTALDATVQMEVLLLLRELQREFGLATIFVTHDIGVAVEVADRIAVMYAGRIVETGPVREVIRNRRPGARRTA